MKLIPHPALRTAGDGAILIGGSPTGVMRLSPAGAKAVRGWFAGETVPSATAHQELAQRLIDRNMAHVAPIEHADLDVSLAVVIPVKDDRRGLQATLAGLRSDEHATASIVVVDDGSSSPATARSADESITIVRHERSRGPAAARNTGLRHPLVRAAERVAFVDAGVLVSFADLRRLACHLDRSPGSVLAAPRVRSATGDGIVDRYERTQSPLDLGPIPTRVAHGSAVSYVPSACVVLERSVAERLGGFDEQLRYGEDVDLLWRLLEEGERADYVASIEATHMPRSTVIELAGQRFGYGSAAGPLADRHGDAVAPWRANGWSAGVIALVLGGRPVFAAGLAAYAGERLTDQLPQQLPDRRARAHRIAMSGHAQTLSSLATAAVRPWWPLTLAATLFGPRRLRRAGLAVATIARLRPLANRSREARQVPLGAALAIGALDDAAYGAGVVVAAFRSRSLRPLIPATRLPNR